MGLDKVDYNISMDNKNMFEYFFNEFLWTRTNTIQLFGLAKKANILQYKPKYLIENPTENHNLLYQFQCVVTSTNTQFRRLRNDKNTRPGIYIKNGETTNKQDIKEENVLAFLKEQIDEAKLMSMNTIDIKKLLTSFITIVEHEALHQGQLVVMFRETKTEFPDEFKKAWNL